VSAPSEWTISSIREALVNKQISARELTKDFYAHIERENPKLNAYLALSPERAYSQADRLDRNIANSESLPPLAAVPIAIKDVLSTVDQRFSRTIRHRMTQRPLQG
jgi:Asp-tRNA(Asn)/Glu-tRNA(Gln) amidotransferase A subunit family amidase